MEILFHIALTAKDQMAKYCSMNFNKMNYFSTKVNKKLFASQLAANWPEQIFFFVLVKAGQYINSHLSS